MNFLNSKFWKFEVNHNLSSSFLNLRENSISVMSNLLINVFYKVKKKCETLSQLSYFLSFF